MHAGSASPRANYRLSRSGLGTDLVDVEARVEVEIVDAGAAAEVEVDQAGGALLLRPLEQQHRGLDRERGVADAAGRSDEREYPPRVVRHLGRRAQRAHASSEDLLRLDGLAQEVGDPDLQEPAGQRVVERVGEHDDGYAPAEAADESLERDETLAALR